MFMFMLEAVEARTIVLDVTAEDKAPELTIKVAAAQLIFDLFLIHCFLESLFQVVVEQQQIWQMNMVALEVV